MNGIISETPPRISIATTIEYSPENCCSARGSAKDGYLSNRKFMPFYGFFRRNECDARALRAHEPFSN